jgi:hypothetical protein
MRQKATPICTGRHAPVQAPSVQSTHQHPVCHVRRQSKPLLLQQARHSASNCNQSIKKTHTVTVRLAVTGRCVYLRYCNQWPACLLLLVQGGNTGQDLALQQLQGGTTCE